MFFRVNVVERFCRRFGEELGDLLRVLLRGNLPVHLKRFRLEDLLGGGPAEPYDLRKTERLVHVFGQPLLRHRVGRVTAPVIRADVVALAESPRANRMIPRHLGAYTGRAHDRVGRVGFLRHDYFHAGKQTL